MADTKWCASCGAEYVARVSRCAECGVALVDSLPPPNPRTEPPHDTSIVEYDLTGWDDDARGALEWMLGGRGIRYEWQSPRVLVVLEQDEQAVDDFVDYLAAGPPDDEPLGEDVDEDGAPSARTIDDFYAGDPARRESEEVEFGSDWTDRDGVRQELSWVEDTGELFLVRADDGMYVEILGQWPDLRSLRRVLDGWEQAMSAPHSVEWVRARVEGATDSPASTATPRDLDAVIGPPPADTFEPPAGLAWMRDHLDALGGAYARHRSSSDPEAALRHAMEEVLDEFDRKRLAGFFAGDMDLVYGSGAGAREQIELRDELERRRRRL